MRVWFNIASFGFFGPRTIGIDLNKEKIYVFKKILSDFYPSTNNIEAKVADALNLDFEDGYFDVIIANEVISHVRNLDNLIEEVNRLLAKGGYFYISDNNNSLDIIHKYQRYRLWKKMEYGPVDESNLRADDIPLPYLSIRKNMIREKYPKLDVKIVRKLAKETAGMYGREIYRAVKEYIETGRIIKKPNFKFRSPVTGEYPEFEFNPLKLKRNLENFGFEAKLIRPYFPPQDSFVRGIAANFICMLHPVSLFVAPHFEILAKKIFEFSDKNKKI